MSLSEVATLMDAAAAALDGGDHALAISKATQAMAKLGPLIHAKKGLTEEAEYSHEGIKAFIAECKIQQSAAKFTAAGGIHRSKIEYGRISD